MFLVTVFNRTELGNKLVHYVGKAESGSFCLYYGLKYQQPIRPDEFPMLFEFLANLDWLNVSEVVMIPT